MAGRILPVALATVSGIAIGMATLGEELKAQQMKRLTDEYNRYVVHVSSNVMSTDIRVQRYCCCRCSKQREPSSYCACYNGRYATTRCHIIAHHRRDEANQSFLVRYTGLLGMEEQAAARACACVLGHSSRGSGGTSKPRSRRADQEALITSANLHAFTAAAFSRDLPTDLAAMRPDASAPPATPSCPWL